MTPASTPRAALRRVPRTLGVLAGTTALVAIATPALAATVGTVGGSALGFQSNLVVLGAAPVTVAALPTGVVLPTTGGNVAKSAVGTGLSPELTVGVMNASTKGNVDPSGKVTSSASVASVKAALGGTPLDLGAVSSTCTATASGVTGSSTFADVDGNTIPTPSDINIPGVVSIRFDEHVVSPDKRSIVVNAIHITGDPLAGHSIVTGDAYVSQSACSTTNASTPVVSEASHSVMLLGIAGVLGVGGTMVVRRRGLGGSAEL